MQRRTPVAAALCGVVLASAAAAQDAPAPSVLAGVQTELGVTYDTNVTRARLSSDILSDEFFSLQLSKDWIVPIAAQSRVTLTGVAGGDAFVHYSGLSRAFAEGQANIDYRTSGEFDAVTFGAFVRVGGDAYKSLLRSGYRLATGLTAQAALTDRINLLGAVGYDERRAESDVFSGRNTSVRLNLDYAATDRDTLYLGADYRRGDVVSSGRASLENIDTAKVLVPDDAFPGGDWFSYRFEADTLVTTVGFNHGFGPKASIDASWRHAVSKPALSPSFPTTVPNRYIADQFTISFVLRF